MLAQLPHKFVWSPQHVHEDAEHIRMIKDLTVSHVASSQVVGCLHKFQVFNVDILCAKNDKLPPFECRDAGHTVCHVSLASVAVAISLEKHTNK